MISKAEKKRIKKVIGHRYVAAVQEELSDSNIVDSKGQPYSSAFITNVMNGVHNEVIEAAIYRAVAKKKKHLAKRKKLLKSA